MKQLEIHKIKDGLHELGVIDKSSVMRDQIVSKIPWCLLGNDPHKCSENVKKTFH